MCSVLRFSFFLVRNAHFSKLVNGGYTLRKSFMDKFSEFATPLFRRFFISKVASPLFIIERPQHFPIFEIFIIRKNAKSIFRCFTLLSGIWKKTSDTGAQAELEEKARLLIWAKHILHLFSIRTYFIRTLRLRFWPLNNGFIVLNNRKI